MVELGIPSLSDFYDMTWREFQLRRIGYERQELKEWRKVREISYWSGAGTAFDASKTKINQFMPLDENKPQASQSGINKLRELQKAYYGSK